MIINTTLMDIATDAVHAGHFRDDSDVIQNLPMFDQLRLERQRLHNSTEMQEILFVISKNSSALWGLSVS